MTMILLECCEKEFRYLVGTNLLICEGSWLREISDNLAKYSTIKQITETTNILLVKFRSFFARTAARY